MAGSRKVAVVVAVVATLVGGGFGFALGGSVARAPQLADPSATGAELIAEFVDILEARDGDRFVAFASPAFQLARADGTGLNREEYAAALPTLKLVEIADLQAKQDGGVLTIRYTSTVTGVTAEGKAFTPGPAPRLSVFTWDGSAWKMAAHGNFNALTGSAAPEGGTQYELDIEASAPVSDQHFHDVQGSGALRYGTARLIGPADLGGSTMEAEILAVVEYTDGAGPFSAFLTFGANSGDELAFRFVGEAEPDEAGTTSINGKLTVIGGTGSYVGVSGAGTLSGSRTGAVGSPVRYTGSVTLVGMP